MRIRIATFNVENLFSRPHAMNLDHWSKGQPVLNDYARLTVLLNQETYSDSNKVEILQILAKYGLDKTRPNNEFLELMEIRGHLLEHRQGQPATVRAKGHADWVGWVELKKDAIADEAITNTARVIADVNPDVLVLVEVEGRPTLTRFHDRVLGPMLKKQNKQPYRYIMVIDGNDPRGIDVGIMSRKPLVRMRSHVDDRTPSGSPTFSRDCPEYYVDMGDTKGMVFLPNHFASKGSDATGKRRRVQSAAVKDIYERIHQEYGQVIVAGDLNDYPGGGSLDPLLKQTDLRDAMSLDAYHGTYPGTYQDAKANEKFDYLLLSPDLSEHVTAVDVNRKGFYAPKRWESYENINRDTKDRNQASDHHCLWADLEL
jgi:endonuclease/exonuclease/phosphatase family metal-dependent hydrolase